MYPISATGPSPENHGFLFLGNHLALDFLNTKPRLDGNFVELLPDFSSIVNWFQAAGLVAAKDAAQFRGRSAPLERKTLHALLDFREALRRSVVLWEQGKPLPRDFSSQLNGLLAQHPMRFRLDDATRTELWFPISHAPDLLAPLAFSAARLFSGEDRTRVRQCDACVLHFLDTSKKGTRRWCSMDVCGNRAKVAAFAARQSDRA